MSQQDKDFATWIYRSVIMGFVTLTFFFVKSNYDEFQVMKKDIQSDKVNHVVIDNRITTIDNRLNIIEARIK